MVEVAAVEGLKWLERLAWAWLEVAWARVLERALETRSTVERVHSMQGEEQGVERAFQPRVVVSSAG